MTASTELDSVQTTYPEMENSEPAIGSSNTSMLESVVSKISILFITASIAGGGYFLAVNGNWFSKREANPKHRSLGYWLTGKTWQERKSSRKIGPFDSVFWPEAKPSDFPKIELPEPDFNFKDFKFTQPNLRMNQPRSRNRR